MKKFRPDKALKRIKQYKDYRKKANVINTEIKQMVKGTRTQFSIDFPKQRKFGTK